MPSSSLFRALLVSLCLSAFASRGLAASQASHVWVSSAHGSDAAGCGASNAPCRTLQFVVDNVVGAGGEIDILDAGAYGPVTIPFALNIVNDGVGVAIVGQPTAGASAIRIAAGASDTIFLRGLSVEGFNSGANGLLLRSGGHLQVTHCDFRNFTNDGISIAPNNGASSVTVAVSDAILSGNGHDGFDFIGLGYSESSISGTLTRVEATGNAGSGVDMFGGNRFAVINLVATDVVANFNGTGFTSHFAGYLALHRTVVTGNQTGFNLDNGYAPLMFQDNLIRGNTTDFSGYSVSPASNGLY